MSDVIRQLNRAIDESGLTRYRLARELCVSEAVLSRIKHGQAGVSLPLLERMAAHLGLRVVLQPLPKRAGRKGA